MKQIIYVSFIFLSVPVFGQSNFESNYKEDSMRFADSKFIRKNLVGQWKDQNSTTIFYKTGFFRTNYDNGEIQTGEWNIERNILSFRTTTPYSFSAYRILSFSSTKFEYQAISPQADTTRWIAFKIKKTTN